MALIPWLDKIIGGEKNMVKDLGAIGTWGRSEYDKGAAGYDDSLGRIDAIDTDATNRLRSGNVLDPSVQRAYSTLRGGIRDRGAGSRVATRASVAQQVAASGGRLSPEQQAALLAMGDETTGQQEFDAAANVGVQESRDTMAAVTDLNDRIERARNTRLQGAQYRMALGADLSKTSILARLDRMKEIGNTVSPW